MVLLIRFAHLIVIGISIDKYLMFFANYSSNAILGQFVLCWDLNFVYGAVHSCGFSNVCNNSADGYIAPDGWNSESKREMTNLNALDNYAANDSWHLIYEMGGTHRYREGFFVNNRYTVIALIEFVIFADFKFCLNGFPLSSIPLCQATYDSRKNGQEFCGFITKFITVYRFPRPLALFQCLKLSVEAES
jgi:hypothetical protein